MIDTYRLAILLIFLASIPEGINLDDNLFSQTYFQLFPYIFGLEGTILQNK